MRSRKAGFAFFSALIPPTTWLLRRVERGSEERGRLSREASAAGWALYLLHARLTVRSALRPSRRLPVGKKPAAALGGVAAVLGSFLFAAGVREFRSFEQMSGVRTGNLVTSGPYCISRNPQVAGWGLALLGAALAGRSATALLFVAAFFLAHRAYLATEERHLERAFGEEYRRYRACVPRFAGVPGTPGKAPVGPKAPSSPRDAGSPAGRRDREGT